MKVIGEDMEKVGLNIVIEREKSRFIATSPDINVFAEGKTIDEAVSKFREGARFHLESFPEERISLMESNEEKFEMPMLTKIFL